MEAKKILGAMFLNFLYGPFRSYWGYIFREFSSYK